MDRTSKDPKQVKHVTGAVWCSPEVFFLNLNYKGLFCFKVHIFLLLIASKHSFFNIQKYLYICQKIIKPQIVLFRNHSAFCIVRFNIKAKKKTHWYSNTGTSHY